MLARARLLRTRSRSRTTQLGYDQATQDAVACAYAAIKVGTAPASCGGAPPPPVPTPLSNSVPVTGIADSTAGNFKYYSLVVPAGQSTLTFTISGGTGDVDLYVNFGAVPTDTVYQCRPYLSGNTETCTFTPPQAGTYYVGLRTYAAYSGVTLTGTYSASSGLRDGRPGPRQRRRPEPLGRVGQQHVPLHQGRPGRQDADPQDQRRHRRRGPLHAVRCAPDDVDVHLPPVPRRQQRDVHHDDHGPRGLVRHAARLRGVQRRDPDRQLLRPCEHRERCGAPRRVRPYLLPNDDMCA